MEDPNSPLSYAYPIVNSLDRLLEKKTILDPDTGEQLYKYIPTGALVKVEDKTKKNEDYQPSTQESKIEEFLNLIEEIDDLYQKMQYIGRIQSLLKKQSFDN